LGLNASGAKKRPRDINPGPVHCPVKTELKELLKAALNGNPTGRKIKQQGPNPTELDTSNHGVLTVNRNAA
jgi:hypothetical protein